MYLDRIVGFDSRVVHCFLSEVQMGARRVRDAEDVGSTPITQTVIFAVWSSLEWTHVWGT